MEFYDASLPEFGWSWEMVMSQVGSLAIFYKREDEQLRIDLTTKPEGKLVEFSLRPLETED